MSPSILAFIFFQFKDISVLLFLAKNMLFEGWGQVKIVLGPTHIVQYLLFSLFPSILAVDFDLIFGLFWTFWALMG